MTAKIETAASNWLFAEPVEYFTTGVAVAVASVAVAVFIRQAQQSKTDAKRQKANK
jgi:hypothetical protein